MSSPARRLGIAGGAGLVRVGTPLALGMVCIWILSKQLEAGAFSGLGPVMAQLTGWQWAGALLATCASFCALGQYDVVLHRHLRTNIPPRHARLSGAAAIAIGQTVGLGIVTGALVRWRLVPGLSLVQATKLASGVAVSFLLGLSLALGVAGLFAPPGVLPPALSAFLIILFLTSGLIIFLYPEVRFRSLVLRMPSLRALGAMSILTLLDTGFAALALWCLMPEAAAVPLAALIPVYMVALGAAILSGTPGGVGPFELVLVALLPQIPDAELVCAILAFRLVYYAAPAIAAALILIRPLSRKILVGPTKRPLEARDPLRARHAEAGLCRQSGAEVLAAGRLRLPVIRPGQSLCMLFGPLSLRGSKGTQDAVALLAHQARQETLIPLIYKADCQLASTARRAGWHALHVADEMVLTPARFRTEGRAFRQLRRKLRKADEADEAGIIVARATTLPWRSLREIDMAWQTRQGPARGVTMGRFCPVYLSHQAVFIARHQDRIVGFASFHTGPNDWCLDLMRTGANAPEGTMHVLITAAIAAAHVQDIAHLSLAALPPARGPLAWLARQIAAAPGLAQFKTSFGAMRSPRYALATTRVGVWLGLLDLWIAIRRPMPRDARDTAPFLPPSDRIAAHEDHENYGFARARNV